MLSDIIALGSYNTVVGLSSQTNSDYIFSTQMLFETAIQCSNVATHTAIVLT